MARERLADFYRAGPPVRLDAVASLAADALWCTSAGGRKRLCAHSTNSPIFCAPDVQEVTPALPQEPVPVCTSGRLPFLPKVRM